MFFLNIFVFDHTQDLDAALIYLMFSFNEVMPLGVCCAAAGKVD